jgi:mercuric ion transport protein
MLLNLLEPASGTGVNSTTTGDGRMAAESAGRTRPSVPSRGAGAAGLAAAGSIVAALASASCCILPLVFFTLGVGGAWIADLTALEPYQPIFFAATAGSLGAGWWFAQRRPNVACAEGGCLRPLPRGIVTGALWSATGLVLAAVAFRFFGPLFLPS